VEKKNRLKLIIHPHFGDLHRRDYLRMPLGLRYGLTQNWEITGEVEAFFAHGLGDIPFFHQEGHSPVTTSTRNTAWASGSGGAGTPAWASTTSRPSARRPRIFRTG
jgi:hypothetical protein